MLHVNLKGLNFSQMSLRTAAKYFHSQQFSNSIIEYHKIMRLHPNLSKPCELGINYNARKILSSSNHCRICVVSPVLLGINHGGGGIATAMSNLAISMAKFKNISVDLLYTQGSYHPSSYEYWADIYARQYSVNLRNMHQDTREHFGTHEMKRSYFVAEYLKDNQYDAVIFPDYLGLGYYSCQAKKNGYLAKTILIINCHGNHRLSSMQGSRPIKGLNELILYELEEKSIEYADIIVSPSRDYLNYWLSTNNELYSRERHYIIPNINDLDVNHFLSRSAPSDEEFSNKVAQNNIFESTFNEKSNVHHIFFYARLERRKGLDIFLEFAHSAAARYECKFYIYGSPTIIDNKKSEIYISENLSKNNIDFEIHTCRPLSEFLNHIKLLDGIFLYTTLWENSPCTIVEMSKNNVKTLTSDIPGILEMLDHTSRSCAVFRTGCIDDLKHKFDLYAQGKITPLLGMSYADFDVTQSWKNLLFNLKKSIKSLKIVSANIRPTCIIPSIGREDTLPQTLDSLWSQSLQPTEIIVVHDSDSPCTKIKAICDQYNCTYLNPGRVFKGAASNLAAQKSESEILVFFDDDDIPGTEYLFQISRAVESGNFDIISSFHSVYENSDDFLSKISNSTSEYVSMCLGGRNLSINLQSNYLAKGCFAIKKSKFNNVGGYDNDEEVLPCVDYRFFLKCILRGLTIGVIPFPIYNYRKNSSRSLFSATHDKVKLKKIKGLIHQIVLENADLNDLRDYLLINIEANSSPKLLA